MSARGNSERCPDCGGIFEHAPLCRQVMLDEDNDRRAAGEFGGLGEEEAPPSLGWHVISGEHLLAVLRRAHAGEDASLLFAELWANAEHEGDETP